MNYEFYNDYELIYLIKEESEEALEMIMRKYEPIIRSIASSFVQNYQMKFDYEDFVQEGRIALLNAIHSFKNEKNILFYSFAILCIKRRLLNMVRMERNNKNYSFHIALDIDDDNNHIDVPDSFNMNSSLEENDFMKKIIEFKNQLDLLDSQIFELRCNDFSYQEIGELLDISIKNVDNRLSKIRKKLKQLQFVRN